MSDDSIQMFKNALDKGTVYRKTFTMDSKPKSCKKCRFYSTCKDPMDDERTIHACQVQCKELDKPNKVDKDCPIEYDSSSNNYKVSFTSVFNCCRGCLFVDDSATNDNDYGIILRCKLLDGKVLSINTVINYKRDEDCPLIIEEIKKHE